MREAYNSICQHLLRLAVLADTDILVKPIYQSFSTYEAKKNVQQPSGHTMVWNGRKKLVWNMEWLKHGMEDLMYGMEPNLPYSTQIPHLHILTWCC